MYGGFLKAAIQYRVYSREARANQATFAMFVGASSLEPRPQLKHEARAAAENTHYMLIISTRHLSEKMVRR